MKFRTGSVLSTRLRCIGGSKHNWAYLCQSTVSISIQSLRREAELWRIRSTSSKPAPGSNKFWCIWDGPRPNWSDPYAGLVPNSLSLWDTHPFDNKQRLSSSKCSKIIGCSLRKSPSEFSSFSSTKTALSHTSPNSNKRHSSYWAR